MSNNNEFELNEDEVSQFITFRIQNYEYGVGIGSIKEIKGWMNVTALPNTPQYVLGVINLRGTVVPIFDLKCRFGLGHSEPTKSLSISTVIRPVIRTLIRPLQTFKILLKIA